MTRRSCVFSLLLPVVLALSSLQPGSAAADLVGYWNFDGSVVDASGNGHDGTVGGTAGSFAETYVNDAPAQVGSGQSFEFNGDTAVYLPSLDIYNTSQTSGTTVSMWVKAQAQSDSRLFGESNTASDRPFYGLEVQSNGSLRWFIRAWTDPPGGSGTTLEAATSSGTYFETSPTPPQWHHVLWTDQFDETDHELKVYIDGVLDKDFAYSWQASDINTTTLGAIHAGSNSLKSPLEGRMDEVAIWNRVLGESYIEDLADGSRGPLPSTLFAADSFDYPTGQLGDGGGAADNDGGLGWQGPWFGAEQVTAPGLQYQDADGMQLVTSGNAGQSIPASADAWRHFDLREDSPADLAGVIDPDSGKIGRDGSSVWFGFLAEYVDGEDTWGGFSLFDGTTEKFLLGKSSSSTEWFFSAKDGSAQNQDFDVDMTDGETALLVGRIDFVDGAGDRITAWLNPDLSGAPDDGDGLTYLWTSEFEFNRIRLAGNATISFDEIRFGTRFSDISGVPEPASALLLVLGLVSLLRVRRRK